jgi:DNA-binding response OmpR family regulator
MRLSCKETDLTAFIRGIFKFYEYNAQQRNINFRFEYPEEPVKAWIDHTQFDKVISNLLSNAFKYTFDNGEVIVRLSQRTDVKQVAIEVIDSGVGFEDDKTERFFERFYQGKHSNDLHIDGTGIGLNLCRALTEMHGGKISAANRTDGTSGAILTVLLPMGNKHLKPEEIEERQKVEYSNHHKKQRASRNFKVLIVDDDEEIGKYIHHELQEWYRFYYASNGKEGLKKLITNQYDLVITDVMMPVMDGISLLRAIKSNPKISDIPVILLTSKSEVSFRLEGLKKGADAFLAKPFAMEELHILIDNLVDNVRRLKGKYSVVSLKEEKVEDVEVKGNDEILMDKVVNCINEHLDDSEFDTEQLAKIIGVSRAHLHRKMKKMVGMTPGEFLRNIRMEQGARLIKEQKINVSQVAYAVGFNTQAHFSIVFKRYFGMNPKDYAMMHHVNTTEESEETTNHQEKTKKI